MTEGICTEREWRKGGAGVYQAGTMCWGAQCVKLTGKRIRHSRRLHVILLLATLVLSVLAAVCFGGRPEDCSYPMAVVPAGSTAMTVRSVPGVSFSLPAGLTMGKQTYISSELYQGRLLLIDEAHPLPGEAPPPDVLNIATYGKGMVPVNDLSLQSGRVTISALTGLFRDLRENGAGCFSVWQGTISAAVQKDAAKAGDGRGPATAAVYAGELQQEYTVEIRMEQAGSQQPDPRPLEETAQGRQLLRLAWRNGFVRTQPQTGSRAAFLFRYVGMAHATAMTYLDVDLPTYLELLHEKRTLTVYGEGGQVFLIQCAPVAGGLVTFFLPADADCDISMDNTGYAVAACTIDRSRSAAQ